jgi:Zn finger protein HypA/HybF involved in hydrogenase expression
MKNQNQTSDNTINNYVFICPKCKCDQIEEIKQYAPIKTVVGSLRLKNNKPDPLIHKKIRPDVSYQYRCFMCNHVISESIDDLYKWLKDNQPSESTTKKYEFTCDECGNTSLEAYTDNVTEVCDVFDFKITDDEIEMDTLSIEHYSEDGDFRHYECGKCSKVIAKDDDALIAYLKDQK